MTYGGTFSFRIGVAKSVKGLLRFAQKDRLSNRIYLAGTKLASSSCINPTLRLENVNIAIGRRFSLDDSFPKPRAWK